MVQVLPPPGWQGDSPATATPETPASTAAANQTPAASDSQPASPQVADSSAAAAPSADAAWEASLAEAAAELDKLPTGTPVETPPAAPPVELPPLQSDWASPTEALWRKVALYVVAGGAALLVVGGLVAYFLSGDSPVASSEETNQQTQQPAAASADEEQPVAETETPADSANVPDPGTATIANEPKVESLLPDKTPHATTPADNTAEPKFASEEPTTTDPAETPAAVSTTEKVATQAKQAADPVETPSNGITTDPGDSFPGDTVASNESVDPARLLSDDSFDALLPGESEAPSVNVPETGRVMTAEELAAAAEAAEDLPAEPDDTSGPAASGLGQNPNDPARAVQRVPIDSRARLLSTEETLAMQLPRVRFSNTPLARLLGEISDLSALPISIDLIALQAANLSPDVPVSVDATDMTLSEVLTELLAPQNLTFIDQGRQILITTSAAAGEPRKVKFSVDDLAGNEEKLQELAALIVKSVSPQTWEFAEGTGKIQLDGDRLLLEHSVPEVYEAVVFCERLRKARDLPVRSRLPASQLQLITAQDRANKILSYPVACTYHEPTRLIEVLRYLEELSGAKIFVDWDSLSHADFGPLDQITCALAEQPLGKSLETLLTPLGLDYRVLDEHTIEVFAQADLPAKMTREFYPVESLLSAGVKMNVLLTGIHQMTGDGAWNDESGGLIWYDPVGQHLLIRNSHKVHAQVAHLLDELSRKLAAKK